MPDKSNIQYIVTLLDNIESIKIQIPPSGKLSLGSITNEITDSNKNDVFAFFQNLVKNLYLVFHYPQLVDNQVIDFKVDGPRVEPTIENTDRILNYIYSSDIPTKKAALNNKTFVKTLLSSYGITKQQFVKLKMLLDEIATIDNVDIFLNKMNDKCEEYDNLITNNALLTFGGNNKKSKGGNNNNNNKKSNKRQNKQQRKNKSLKRKN